MKIFALVVILSLSSLSARALEGSCPNLTGTYMAENDQIRFDQLNCERIDRSSAYRENKDGYNYGVIRRFELNGTPFLFDGLRGEAVTLLNDAYVFTFNFAGGHRYIAGHGFCEVPKMILVKSDRNIKATFHAENCEDGFSGTTESRWNRLSH